ncbi:hypothetical protein QM012_006338 [Aureobasidium pullulans]|uniref:Thioredoxin domain-containing protein n=1 Tax=Aureobasidium pullulans TaxID=5580 RepID=A0ABR0TTV6_AURPU
MPLIEKSYPAIMSAIKSSSVPKTSFLVFYSSIVDGKMWCPDCVDVEPSVREAFDGADKPEAMLFYVGKKEEWRTLENVARVDWNVRGIPTIIKLEEGKETARVTETEILDNSKWQAFLKN